jgi:hypothetical protein
MTCVNQTRPHCINQMGETQPKPLAARHGIGMGTEWYCELVYIVPCFLSWAVRPELQSATSLSYCYNRNFDNCLR